jgi:DNA-binding NtrC family response regulator
MSLLIVDRESRCRRDLLRRFAAQHDTLAIGACAGALRCLQQRRHAVVLVNVRGCDPFALTILRWRMLLGLDTPTVVLLGRGAWHQAKLLLLYGASAVRRWPSDPAEVALALAVAEGIAKLRRCDRTSDGIAPERAMSRLEPPRLPAGAAQGPHGLHTVDELLGCCATGVNNTRGLLKRNTGFMPVWQQN